MTRKDYIRFAEKFRSNKGSCAMTTGEQSWTILMKALADVLAEDNNRFDYQRFFEACHGQTLARKAA